MGAHPAAQGSTVPWLALCGGRGGGRGRLQGCVSFAFLVRALSLSVFSSACLLGDGFDEQDDVLVVGASSGAVLAAYGRSGVLPVASRVSRVSFYAGSTGRGVP